MSHILIIEPNMSGHHGPYVRWIVEAALAHDLKVTLATSSEAVSHTSMIDIKNEFGDHCEIVALPWRKLSAEGRKKKIMPPLLETQLINYRFWADAYRCVSNVDFVFVPSVDGCLYYTALRGSPFQHTRWGGIVMRPHFNFAPVGMKGPTASLSGRLKERFFIRLLAQKTLCELITIDETLPVYLSLKNRRFVNKIRYLADPNEINTPLAKADGRASLGLDEGKWVILLFGSLSWRKGVVDLLNATISNQWPPECQVLLMGRPDSDVQKQILRPEVQQAIRDRRVQVIDRYVTDTKRDAALAACDAVWCCYKQFYQMSGVLVLAGLARRPVVASCEGLIGWLTKKYNCGVVLEKSNPATVCSTIHKLVADTRHSEVMGDNGARYFAAHSITNAKNTIGAFLEQNAKGDGQV